MFLEKNKIEQIGFKFVGNNVQISDKASFYDVANISIGNNVRIDDFCILSGHIEIKNYVHISAYTALYGKYGIKIGNFCGISPRCTLLSASDDFSGNYMISPIVDSSLVKLTTGAIVLEDYCQIGANSIVMPNITFEEGAVCGAFSFVKNNLKKWNIYAGIPVKLINRRDKNIKKMAENYYENNINSSDNNI